MLSTMSEWASMTHGASSMDRSVSNIPPMRSGSAPPKERRRRGTTSAPRMASTLGRKSRVKTVKMRMMPCNCPSIPSHLSAKLSNGSVLSSLWLKSQASQVPMIRKRNHSGLPRYAMMPMKRWARTVSGSLRANMSQRCWRFPWHQRRSRLRWSMRVGGASS